MNKREAIEHLKACQKNNGDCMICEFDATCNIYEVEEIAIECINACDYINQVLEDAEARHPYRVSGKPETYSDYNQGWQDALIFIDASLDWSEYK